MSRWRDTKPEHRILAERLDGERVRFSDLRPGDVVRFVAPDGNYIDPVSHEDDHGVWSRVTDGPWKADGTRGHQDYGWCFEFEYVEPSAIKATLH